MNQIKFYSERTAYLGPKTDPSKVFLTVPDTEGDCATPDCIMTYAPIGQHSEALKSYIENDCIQITKEEYLKISEGIYTPAEYIKEPLTPDDVHLIEVRLASNIDFLEWVLKNYGDFTLRRSAEELENGEPANLSNIINDLKDVDSDLQDLELQVKNNQ